MGGSLKAAVYLRTPVISSGPRPHLALDVSQVNGLCSDIQEHLLAPQLLVLGQEGKASLRLLHTLDVAVLQ